MIKMIAIDDVIVPRGRRSTKGIEGLASSIEAIGLLNPITVTEAMRLVAGRNRLEAYRHLGRPKILASIIDLNELDAELAEIDENLIRNELTVLERSEQLARRKEIYEAKHPETRHGGSLGNQAGKRGKAIKDDKLSSLMSFANDTASKLGASHRTIQRDIQIAKQIDGEVKNLIRDTGLADHQSELLKLARLTPEEQKQVAEKIVGGECTSVSQAQRSIDPQPEPEPWILIDGLQQLRNAVLKILERWPREKLDVLGARLISMGNEIIDRGEIH